VKTISESQFAERLLGLSTHWIDVRAPVEFVTGTVPGAVNLPLLTDDERKQVGTTYRHEGQDAAVALGHRLVGGSIKEARIQQWSDEIQAHPDSAIFCFRGGLRSQITQSWLRERGVDRPIVYGGYKALRRFFLKILEVEVPSLRFEVVSGPTGSGKTHFLWQSDRPFVDLEGLAHHRGSAFGAMESAQPGQVDFENGLALELLRAKQSGEPILIEDESRMIGKRILPEALFHHMQESPRRVLDVSFDQRVENIFCDYVSEDPAQFDRFKNSVQAISRRLGSLRSREILNDLQFSQSELLAGRGLESNRVWIAKLLKWYYDPMYARR